VLFAHYLYVERDKPWFVERHGKTLVMFPCCISADARKVDALDQWCLRRILDIRWYHPRF